MKRFSVKIRELIQIMEDIPGGIRLMTSLRLPCDALANQFGELGFGTRWKKVLPTVKRHTNHYNFVFVKKMV